MVGPELERYQILGELGQGGMSVVYRARDKALARDVAVKVLHDFLARQPDAKKRFHREAVAVAKLHHPGILEIFDYSGPDARQSYIVTELIDGVTLRERVEDLGPPPFPELGVMIVLELVRALKHAHEQSVLHRDLKPENVMITRSGSLKLMDFGLAQLMDGGTKLTATGTLLGSPAHMAPEVIDGKSSDARADIFSMGTILYWLTAGRLPFEAPNPSALFKKILDGKYEDPQLVEPKIGNGLARVIRRTLEPDPEQRYLDVTDLERDLEAELAEVELFPHDLHLRRYLVDPEGAAKELGPRLVALLAAAGKKALADHNVARATDRFTRVLAIDPEHAEVRALVARLGKRRDLERRLRRLGAATAVVLAAGGAAWAAATFGRGIVAGEPAPGSARLAVATASVASRPRTAAAEEMRTTGEAPGVNRPPEPSPDRRPERPSERVPERLVERPRERATHGDAVDRAKTEARAKNEKHEGWPPDGGAPSARTGAEPEAHTPATEGPVRLKVTIGGGFALAIWVDGHRQASDGNGYDELVTLLPGRHELVVEDAKGKRPPNAVEVDAGGEIYELRPSGARVAITRTGLRVEAQR